MYKMNVYSPFTYIILYLKGCYFNFVIKFPFKRKACQVYRVKYGRGRI